MDLAILYGIQDAFGSPFMDAVMPFITMLGEHGFVWIALAAVLLISKKTRGWGIAMLVALAIVYVLGMWVVKPIVARPRPFMAVSGYPLLIDAPSGYSFPSGHASSSFAAAVVFCFIPAIKKRWKIAAVVLAVLIAFSRLYLFVHYPSDVAAGIALGIVGGLAVACAYRAIQRKRRRGSATS